MPEKNAAGHRRAPHRNREVLATGPASRGTQPTDVAAATQANCPVTRANGEGGELEDSEKVRVQGGTGDYRCRSAVGRLCR
ncbi:MAG: hypothetical protein MZV63_21570 [Marinilabiliales bacterium]|nr:hypothetical protein [Marinilabiliales bacterium]